MKIPKPKKLNIKSIYSDEAHRLYQKFLDSANGRPCGQVFYVTKIVSEITLNHTSFSFEHQSVHALNLDLTDKDGCLEKIDKTSVIENFVKWM